jgi:hypothetical protein
MKNRYILVFLCSTFTTFVDAQSFYSVRRDRSLIALVGLNTATYYGDLKSDSDLIDVRPSISLGIMTDLNERFSVRSELSWIFISGHDYQSHGNGTAGRNLSFYSNNYELNVSGVINIFRQRGRFYQRPNFNFYGFLGIGALYFNPMAFFDGKSYALQPLQTEGVKYSRFTFVIPLGLGGRVKLTPFLNLALEAGWRKTFTDYLDDVSTVHIDQASITNPITKKLTDRRHEVGLPLAPPGTKRGNPREKDAYMLLSLKLEYYLPIQPGSNRQMFLDRLKYR